MSILKLLLYLSPCHVSVDSIDSSLGDYIYSVSIERRLPERSRSLVVSEASCTIIATITTIITIIVTITTSININYSYYYYYHDYYYHYYLLSLALLLLLLLS